MEYLIKWKNLRVEDLTWYDQSFIEKLEQLTKHRGQHLSKGEGHVKPQVVEHYITLLYNFCWLGSISYTCILCVPYVIRRSCQLNHFVLHIDVMYKEVSPSKWLLIWFSLIFKAWSTSSYVFTLFGNLVHNTLWIYFSSMGPYYFLASIF